MDIGGSVMVKAGYVATKTVTGALRKGERETITLDLDGPIFQIAGSCDNGCDDLDFRLLDSDGRLVEEDVEGDDAPIVTAETAKGKYTLQIIMVACEDRCAYVARVFKMP